MDPNATLARIRQLVKPGAEHEDPDGAELSELVQALDEWLSRGGFLPHEWQAKTDRLAKIGELSHRFTGGIGRSESDQIRQLTEPEPLGGPVPGVNGAHLPGEDH